MKTHLIYLSIGGLTFILNLLLSLHMVRRRSSARRKSMEKCEDMITFNLKAEGREECNTTEAVLCDDTEAFQ